MRRSAFFLAAVSGLAAIPSVASAQEQTWLQDRRYREGIGIRVGDLELHPGAAAEFGYDSNYYRRADNEDPVASLRLRITPSFSLATLSPQRRGATADTPPPDIDFRATISATYNEFFPVSGNAFDRSNFHDQRDIGGNLGLSLGILPGRPWSGVLFGDVGRAISPSEQGLSTFSFDRVTARAGGELIFTPGGGLLDWRLGYTFSGTFFEDIASLSNINNSITTRGRWRFLPRTSLMYDASFGFVSYPSAESGVRGKTGSHPVRARLGVNGLVTQSFAVTAMAGWGASFYTGLPAVQQEDFDSVIGQLELKWFISPDKSPDPRAVQASPSSVALGFERDFSDSYIGTFFARNRGYANLSYFVGRSVLLSAEGGASANVYPNIPAFNLVSFTDLHVDATLFGEYRIRDTIGINTTLRYGQNISSTRIETIDPQAGQVFEELKWQEIEAYLGVRWFL